MFIGREGELADLAQLWKKKTSSFVTCRGRRRIGKSSLIEEFARRSDCRFIEIAGTAPQPKMTNADQLANFVAQLALQSDLPRNLSASNWLEAFSLLDMTIRDRERTVVLLDEVSWMGRYDANFAGMLKTAWDTRLKKHDRLIVVVCGSVSTWISQNILESSAFAGRLSLNLTLEELPLNLCVRFWGEKRSRLAVKDILDVLAVTGGVPKYLEEIDSSVSADENIRRLCFTPEGALVEEFEQIFSEVFEESASIKKSILRSLSEGPLAAGEIAERLGTERNGHLTRHLRDLEAGGFVAREGGLNPETDKPLKVETYRIKDNYTRFYLHHIEPRIAAIKSGTFMFASLGELQGWSTIVALQFENLVVSHYRELLPFLHIGRQLILSAAPYSRRGTKTREGVQVDLLLQMKSAVYVIEVKHQTRIDSSIEREMREKISRISFAGEKSKRVVLVHAGEIDAKIAEDGYFDAIVSDRELLGL